MLAFLDGRSRPARPGAEVRAEFTAWWTEHPEYATWQPAWTAYDANIRLQRACLGLVTNFKPDVQFIPPVDVTPPRAKPVQTPAPPLWLQRARQRQAALFS